MQQTNALKHFLTRFLKVIFVTMFALLALLVASLLSKSMDWGLEDFVFAGLLMLVTGLLYVAFTQGTISKKQQLVIGALCAALFAYLWLEFAVGVFTSLGS